MDEAKRAAARRAVLVGALVGTAVGIPLWIFVGDPFSYIGAGVAGLTVGLAVRRKLDPPPPTQGSVGRAIVATMSLLGLPLIFAALAALLNGEYLLAAAAFAVWLVALFGWHQTRDALRQDFARRS